MEEGGWVNRERDGLLSSDDVFSALRESCRSNFLLANRPYYFRHNSSLHAGKHGGKEDEEEEGAIAGGDLGRFCLGPVMGRCSCGI